jgi:DNA-binding XRE family transcriptional regulator
MRTRDVYSLVQEEFRVAHAANENKVVTDDERASLVALLNEARDVVARLEAALSEGEGGEEAVHPVVIWRKRRHLSQADLARAVGLSAPAICRIENSPGFACRRETREKIAAVLDVPVDWLYRG